MSDWIKLTPPYTSAVDTVSVNLVVGNEVAGEAFGKMAAWHASHLAWPFAPRDLAEKILGNGLRGARSIKDETTTVLPTGSLYDLVLDRVKKWCSDDSHGLVEIVPGAKGGGGRFRLSAEGIAAAEALL